jgi:DNA-binding MurR/RpiR family transcriptional regulator
MNIVEKIQQYFDVMTKSERRVSSYFLQHLNDFSFNTLDRIASDIGLSTTSVIRFCRRLGFEGFKDFQLQLRREIQNHSTLKNRLEHMNRYDDSLLTQIVQSGIGCIEKTFAEIPETALPAAVRLLMDAKRIFIYGAKETYALVQYAYTRFVTVRSDAFILGAYHGTVEALCSLKSDDLCVVFLFHRYSKESLRLIPMLKKQGAKVLLITSSPFDTVQQYADLLIPCHVDIRGVKNSYLAPVCLVDYLCNAVAMQQGEKTTKHIQCIEELIHLSDTMDSE